MTAYPSCRRAADILSTKVRAWAWHKHVCLTDLLSERKVAAHGRVFCTFSRYIFLSSSV
jgi:hypothetical protein